LSKSQQRVNERKVGSENLASNGKATYHNIGSHQQYVPERKNLIQDFDHIQKMSPKEVEPLNRYSAKKAAILTIDSLQESENLSTVDLLMTSENFDPIESAVEADSERVLCKSGTNSGQQVQRSRQKSKPQVTRL
jgi:hypothetical protein